MSKSHQSEETPPCGEPVWQDVGSIQDLPNDSGLAVCVRGKRIALFRQGGGLVAVEDLCPHQATPLSGGLVQEGVLTCPLHAWQFRLSDGGNVDGGPGLETFPARLWKDRLQVQID